MIILGIIIVLYHIITKESDTTTLTYFRFYDEFFSKISGGDTFMTTIFLLICLLDLGILVYILEIFFTHFEVQIHVPFLVVDFVLSLCLYFIGNKIINNMIYCIVGGINFYIIFYVILNEVNTVSLLFFWSDLWFILLGVYVAIENHYIKYYIDIIDS